MPVRLTHRFNESVSVERGPLVYALQIGESWRKLRQTGPVVDWEVYPSTPWNYGLRVDPDNPAPYFQLEEVPVARQPFGTSPPVLLKAKARRLPQWMMVDDSAGPPPPSPVTLRIKEEMVNTPQDENVTLIPYGAARLRVTSFPVLGPDAPPRSK